MKLIHSLAVAACLTIPAGFASADSHQAEIEAELHAFSKKFNELVADYDIEGLLALYPEESLWIAPTVPAVPGREGIVAVMEFLKDNNGTNVSTVDQVAISEDGTLAMVVGLSKTVVEEVGLDAIGTYQFVLQNNGNGWVVLSDMYNDHQVATQ